MSKSVVYGFECHKCKSIKVVTFKDGGPAEIACACDYCDVWFIAELPNEIGASFYRGKPVSTLELVPFPSEKQ
jgi:hypothetical protein